jgi:serine/arginine repetitive matrix protein 2
MLDGSHIRRRSVYSVVGGSPSTRAGKRKRVTFQSPQDHLADLVGNYNEANSYSQNRLSRRSSIESLASAKSLIFGDERMTNAREGMLHRRSLKESALEAEGEDLSVISMLQLFYFRTRISDKSDVASFKPVFTRPTPAARSRSNTVDSYSDSETPSLSLSASLSSNSDSQGSIDVASLNLALSKLNTVNPARPRPRPQRGQSFRRDFAIRQSIYETIQEETSAQNSPIKRVPSVVADDVIIVDEGRISLVWDDEESVAQMRKYYNLREEAENILQDSKRMWLDTPFSAYAMQCKIYQIVRCHIILTNHNA